MTDHTTNGTCSTTAGDSSNVSGWAAAPHELLRIIQQDLAAGSHWHLLPLQQVCRSWHTHYSTAVQTVAASRSKEVDLETIAAAYPALQQLSLTQMECHVTTTHSPPTSSTPCISKLQALQSVHLGMRRSTAPLASHTLLQLSTLHNLTALHLSDCPLEPQSTAGLAHLTALTALRLPNCDLTECKLQGILLSLQQLVVLDLSRNPKLGEAECIGLAVLGRCSSLTSLDVSDCKLGDAALHEISALPHLQALNLSCFNRFSDAGLAALAALTRLRSLNLAYLAAVGTGTVAAIGKPLAHCLQDLDLRDTSRANDPNTLHALTSLTRLAWTFGVGQPRWGRVAHALPKLRRLRSLTLPAADQREAHLVLAAICALPSLTHLDLRGWRYMEMGHFMGLHRCSALRHLALDMVDTVRAPEPGEREEEPAAFLEPMAALHTLQLRGAPLKGRLSGCDTDGAAHPLLGLTSLTNLTLQRCGLTNGDVAALAGVLTALVQLKVYDPCVSAEGIAALAVLPALTCLAVSIGNTGAPPAAAANGAASISASPAADPQAMICIPPIKVQHVQGGVLVPGSGCPAVAAVSPPGSWDAQLLGTLSSLTQLRELTLGNVESLWVGADGSATASVLGSGEAMKCLAAALRPLSALEGLKLVKGRSASEVNMAQMFAGKSLSQVFGLPRLNGKLKALSMV